MRIMIEHLQIWAYPERSLPRSRDFTATIVTPIRWIFAIWVSTLFDTHGSDNYLLIQAILFLKALRSQAKFKGYGISAYINKFTTISGWGTNTFEWTRRGTTAWHIAQLFESTKSWCSLHCDDGHMWKCFISGCSHTNVYKTFPYPLSGTRGL